MFVVAPMLVAASAYSISVVGAQGRLGRELVVQSLQRGWTVHGVVRRPEEGILLPSRSGWLSSRISDADSVHVSSDRLHLTTDTACPPDVDGVVFAMSARPFASKEELSIQNEVVARMCRTSSSPTSSCSKLCLVSAFGAGDSLPGSNVAYQIMHDFYLKEGYSAKEEQEEIVRLVGESADGMETLILRPRVLCFETIPVNPMAVVRSELACQILDWMGS